MAGGGGGKSRPSALSINLTPMIDCTMLLVIFFLLTTQMASPDFVKLKLPKPHGSVARDTKEGNKATINVVPYSEAQVAGGLHKIAEAMEYRLGTNHYRKEELMRLVEKLVELRRTSSDPKEFLVEIRSDFRIDYSEVEPVFQVLQKAQIQKVHVTALRTLGG